MTAVMMTDTLSASCLSIITAYDQPEVTGWILGFEKATSIKADAERVGVQLPRALHRLSKKRRSRARSGQLQRRVGPLGVYDAVVFICRVFHSRTILSFG